MKTQEQFAEEILEQCQNGTSVSNLMAMLEEYRIQLASQIEPQVRQKNAEIIERLQELQSLYNENEPQYNAFGIAVNEIKRTFYTEPLEREQNTGSCNWDYLRSR